MPQNEQDTLVESQSQTTADPEGKTLEQQLAEWHESIGQELVRNLNSNVLADDA